MLTKIRIFGSPLCENCKELCKRLTEDGLEYTWLDADAEEHEDLCDQYEVEYLPHIQILYRNKVVFNHVGPIESDVLKVIFNRLKNKYCR